MKHIPYPNSSAQLETLNDAVLSYTKDFFGNTVISEHHNQVEVPFDDTNWQDYATLTTLNGGTFSQSSGQVTLTSGTNINGRVAVIAKDSVKYRPNHEIGFGFTWKIPTESILGVSIRIGATDNISTWANGVFFQHKDGVFSLVYTRNGAEIFAAPQSQWVDPCDGSVTSLYRDFDDEVDVLDITKDQLCRIHCGLFGHAGFVVELLAPNQKWIPIYSHTNINLSDVPVFGNFDLTLGAEIKKTNGGALSYTLATACWAGWTGTSFQRMNAPISDRSLVQLVRSVITGRTTAGGGGFVDVKVNPSGALTVESTTTNAALETTAQQMLARSSGSILSGITWNYFSVAYPNITTDVYTYRQGGATGTIVRVVTITYTDATRNKISTCGYV